ncbi:hypothetical protein [Massilia sp. METH4]|uniref:hypothetical protein n=1 Tax=Massilia sp. METH4 TaxID=3123041 RepID=UPI0030CB8CC9
MHQQHDTREPIFRSDEATAAIIEEALRLCASEGIDGAIRYMEQRALDRSTILRVLCSPKFRRNRASH